MLRSLIPPLYSVDHGTENVHVGAQDHGPRDWLDSGFDGATPGLGDAGLFNGLLAHGHYLGLVARRIPADWQTKYGRPVHVRDEDPEQWAEIAHAFHLWRRREYGDQDLIDS